MATKKDYSATAKILSYMFDELDGEAEGHACNLITDVIYKFADYYAQEKLHFNRALFLKTCGVPEKE